MLLALFVLMITTLLLGAAYVAVINDSGSARNDIDQKRAYAAAQAGISQYSYNLNQNPNYWETCNGWGTPSRARCGATESGSTENYSVKPVIATGPLQRPAVRHAPPIGTMIEGTAAARRARSGSPRAAPRATWRGRSSRSSSRRASSTTSTTPTTRRWTRRAL